MCRCSACNGSSWQHGPLFALLLRSLLWHWHAHLLACLQQCSSLCRGQPSEHLSHPHALNAPAHGRNRLSAPTVISLDHTRRCIRWCGNNFHRKSFAAVVFIANHLRLQIVPEAVRTSVYAFDKSIVMALGAISTPLSGLLAEKVFGATTLSVHKPSQRGGGHAHAPAPAVAKEHANNLTNAHALENGLLTTLLIPLVLKFIIYTFLYCTFLPLPVFGIHRLKVVPSQDSLFAHAICCSSVYFQLAILFLCCNASKSSFIRRDPATRQDPGT